jgi:hypothetical protein
MARTWRSSPQARISPAMASWAQTTVPHRERLLRTLTGRAARLIVLSVRTAGDPP